MFDEIRAELDRVSASGVKTTPDAEFEPSAGELVKIELGEAYWHMQPTNFLELLKQLPDDAGAEGVREAIETKGHPIWHGPSPDGEREQ